MALIDSSISHDKFVLINNMVKTIWGYERRHKQLFKCLSLLIKQFYWIVESAEKI